MYALTHAVLHPFLAHPISGSGSIEATRLKAIQGCSLIYTSHLEQQSFNERGALIKDSIEIVLEKLCTWEWNLFEWSDRQTWDLLRHPGVLSSRVPTVAKAGVLSVEIADRAAEASNMLKYTGWDLWESCDRQRAWDVSPRSNYIYFPRKTKTRMTWGRRSCVTYPCGQLFTRLGNIKVDLGEVRHTPRKKKWSSGGPNAFPLKITATGVAVLATETIDSPTCRGSTTQ